MKQTNKPDMYKVKYVLYPDQILAEKIRLSFFAFADYIQRKVTLDELTRLKKVNRWLYALDDHSMRFALRRKRSDTIRLDQSIRVTDNHIKLGSLGKCNYQGLIGERERVNKQDICRVIKIKHINHAYVAICYFERIKPELTRKQPRRPYAPKTGREEYGELRDMFCDSRNRRDIWTADYTNSKHYDDKD